MTERRLQKLSQDNRDESSGSKTLNILASPQAIKPTKIEELLLDQSVTKEKLNVGKT